VSAEEIADAEEAQSETDAYTDADARAEAIELDNDAKDQLVAESQEVSDEVIDADEHDRG
jgi:N utilization substance protein A